MAAQLTAWKEITPEHLVPAVEHIRNSFNTAAWKCSEVTKRLCYASLHQRATDSIFLAPYKVAFVKYQGIVGSAAQHEFDNLVRVGSPPSVFKAYIDLFRKGLEVEIRNQFNQLLLIGLANVEAVRIPSVEWAKSHLQLLINDSAYRVKIWVKEVCDEQAHSKSLQEDFEEVVFWKTWRAPKLIHMQPSGNTPYDAATAWTREDESWTEKLLDGLSRRFVQFLGLDLDKIAGDAHVWLAQSKEHTQVPQVQLERPSPEIRRISNAPKPPTVLNGRGSWTPRPKATQVPLDWPPYYPNHLIPRTTVIIGEAIKKFPLQAQTLELCKCVISELTPQFCAAVLDKMVRGDLALSRMSDLLHYLLVANCDDASARFNFEREIKKSDEWLELAREVAGETANGGSVNADSSQQEACRSPQPNRGGAPTWETIEILFLSDERVQIRNGTNTETRNYAEFGFHDARNGKPNRAWETLRALAEQRGVIRDATTAGQEWPKVEKRIQEIRKVFRERFTISHDPIPFVAGAGYQACFKIGCSPSFHT